MDSPSETGLYNHPPSDVKARAFWRYLGQGNSIRPMGSEIEYDLLSRLCGGKIGHHQQVLEMNAMYEVLAV